MNVGHESCDSPIEVRDMLLACPAKELKEENVKKQKKKILIVDDEPGVVAVLGRLFRRNGYETIFADNGKEALEIIENDRPDMVLLDLMLPGLSGIEICRRVRGNPLICHIPILMITGLSEPEEQAQCLRAGADDFVIKPFSLGDVKARVDELFKRRQSED
ncbi:PleD family two-component system response regulator [Elusimicrobiota bacterium]